MATDLSLFDVIFEKFPPRFTSSLFFAFNFAIDCIKRFSKVSERSRQRAMILKPVFSCNCSFSFWSTINSSLTLTFPNTFSLLCLTYVRNFPTLSFNIDTKDMHKSFNSSASTLFFSSSSSSRGVLLALPSPELTKLLSHFSQSVPIIAICIVAERIFLVHLYAAVFVCSLFLLFKMNFSFPSSFSFSISRRKASSSLSSSSFSFSSSPSVPLASAIALSICSRLSRFFSRRARHPSFAFANQFASSTRFSSSPQSFPAVVVVVVVVVVAGGSGPSPPSIAPLIRPVSSSSSSSSSSSFPPLVVVVSRAGFFFLFLYYYICVCVCVCVSVFENFSSCRSGKLWDKFDKNE